MFGLCQCCKDWKNLTKHHDKVISKVILIYRDCHDVVEEYDKLQKRAQDYKE